jgi:phospholipid/cholesterol/gamma-HCH transport system substrate-binding protein
MASQKTKFAVGLFVASGMGIAVLSLIWLGMSRYLEKGQFYVTYFDQSVQGLERDSPVKYRGVAVGRVDSIGVAPDAKLIQVVLKIESGQPLASDIVAQLKSVGITGIMFVELDRMKADEEDLSPPLSFPSEYPIVASKPSDISQILKGIDEFLSQMRSTDLVGISEKVKLALDNINQKISEADIKGISDNVESTFEATNRILGDQRWDKIMASVEGASHSLNTLLRKARKSLNRVENTLAHVEGIVTEKDEEIKAAIGDFRLAMEKANVFLEKGSLLVSGTDDAITQLKRHLLVVVQNLERASEDLTRLTELVADQPSQLIFGQPPDPRKVEPEAYER